MRPLAAGRVNVPGSKNVYVVTATLALAGVKLPICGSCHVREITLKVTFKSARWSAAPSLGRPGCGFGQPGRSSRKGEIYSAPEVLETTNRYNENDSVSKLVHSESSSVLVAQFRLGFPIRRRPVASPALRKTNQKIMQATKILHNFLLSRWHGKHPSLPSVSQGPRSPCARQPSRQPLHHMLDMAPATLKKQSDWQYFA